MFVCLFVSAKSVLRTVLLEPQRHIQAPDSDPELTMGQVLDGQSPGNLEAGITITLISQVRKQSQSDEVSRTEPTGSDGCWCSSS